MHFHDSPPVQEACHIADFKSVADVIGPGDTVALGTSRRVPVEVELIEGTPPERISKSM